MMNSLKVLNFEDFILNEQMDIELSDGGSEVNPKTGTKEESSDSAENQPNESEETSDAGEESDEDEGSDEKVSQYKVGDEVVFLRDDQDPKNYDDSKDAKEQKKIVSVKKITKIDGDEIYFKLEDGREISKTSDKILGPYKKPDETVASTKESLTSNQLILKFEKFIQ